MVNEPKSTLSPRGGAEEHVGVLCCRGLKCQGHTQLGKGHPWGLATDGCKREACLTQTLSRVLPDWAGCCTASAERSSCQRWGGGAPRS